MNLIIYFSGVNMTSEVHEEIVWQMRLKGFSKIDCETLVDKYVSASADDDKRYVSLTHKIHCT